jgi:two-component system phosphate regulon sensor histidine kinase PhoR
VRGDTEFDRDALARLENHAGRPEVRQALATGVGRDQRLSASTNQPRLYVAVRADRPDLAVVRLSTTLDAVDKTVWAVQRGVLAAGLAALGIAALLAWTLSRAIARQVVQLGHAARAIAAGESPVFPDSRIREITEHVLALRTMHEQLDQRFGDLQREREETHTLIESMADGLLATDAAGNVATANTAARRLLSRRASEPLPPVTEMFHDKRARELVRAALDGREFEQRELDLEGRALLVSSRPLPNGGALLVFRDVTELRRLEAVRRDFVANVSHVHRGLCRDARGGGARQDAGPEIRGHDPQQRAPHAAPGG